MFKVVPPACEKRHCGELAPLCIAADARRAMSTVGWRAMRNLGARPPPRLGATATGHQASSMTWRVATVVFSWNLAGIGQLSCLPDYSHLSRIAAAVIAFSLTWHLP